MPKLAIIDGSILIDLGDGDRDADEVVTFLHSQGYVISLTPTGALELVDTSIQGNGEAEFSQNALLGLQTFLAQGVQLQEVDALWRGIAFEAAHAMIAGGGCPEELLNVALIVAEAAALDAKLVVFDDSVCDQIDRKTFRQVLESRDLYAPKIFSRTEMLKLVVSRPD